MTNYDRFGVVPRAVKKAFVCPAGRHATCGEGTFTPAVAPTGRRLQTLSVKEPLVVIDRFEVDDV